MILIIIDGDLELSEQHAALPDIVEMVDDIRRATRAMHDGKIVLTREGRDDMVVHVAMVHIDIPPKEKWVDHNRLGSPFDEELEVYSGRRRHRPRLACGGTINSAGLGCSEIKGCGPWREGPAPSMHRPDFAQMLDDIDASHTKPPL